MANGCLPQSDPALLAKDSEANVNVICMDTDSPRKRRGALFSPALIFALVLTSLLGIAGFIMAAWSTHQLKTANELTTSLTSAILVRNRAEAPSDYDLLINMFQGTGYWAEKQPMPFYRSDHGVAAYNNSAYIIGGYSFLESGTSRNKTILNRLVRYDPVYSTIETLPDMIEARARFSWAVIGDRLFVFGGYTDVLSQNAVATTLIYNFVTKTWSRSAAVMNVPRTDTCAGTINGMAYVAGGYDETFATSDVIEMYDPNTDRFTVMPTKLITGRGDCVSVVLSDQLYVMGGTYALQPPGVDCSVEWYKCYGFSGANERYDPAAKSMTALAGMTYSRGDFGAAVTSSGRILVAGGEGNDIKQGVYRLLARPWVEEYDVASDFWTPKAPMPQARFRFNMVAAGDEVLAFGGQPSCPVANQEDDTPCYVNGLNSVLHFTDLQGTYPTVFLLARNVTRANY